MVCTEAGGLTAGPHGKGRINESATFSSVGFLWMEWNIQTMNMNKNMNMNIDMNKNMNIDMNKNMNIDMNKNMNIDMDMNMNIYEYDDRYEYEYEYKEYTV